MTLHHNGCATGKAFPTNEGMSNLGMKWIGCAPNNFRAGRPPELEVTAVVIHIIDGSRIGADATFLDNALAVPRSAHYSVGVDGSVH